MSHQPHGTTTTTATRPPRRTINDCDDLHQFFDLCRPSTLSELQQNTPNLVKNATDWVSLWAKRRDGRPLLLGGGDGYGKRTLVRLVSMTCGYALVEMTTTDLVHNRAWLMSNRCPSTHRPRLLAVTDVMTDASVDCMKPMEQVMPVIYICDDPYSKSMTKLRQGRAEWLEVKAPSATSLSMLVGTLRRKGILPPTMDQRLWAACTESFTGNIANLLANIYFCLHHGHARISYIDQHSSLFDDARAVLSNTRVNSSNLKRTANIAHDDGSLDISSIARDDQDTAHMLTYKHHLLRRGGDREMEKKRQIIHESYPRMCGPERFIRDKDVLDRMEKTSELLSSADVFNGRGAHGYEADVVWTGMSYSNTLWSGIGVAVDGCRKNNTSARNMRLESGKMMGESERQRYANSERLSAAYYNQFDLYIDQTSFRLDFLPAVGFMIANRFESSACRDDDGAKRKPSGSKRRTRAPSDDGDDDSDDIGEHVEAYMTKINGRPRVSETSGRRSPKWHEFVPWPDTLDFKLWRALQHVFILSGDTEGVTTTSVGVYRAKLRTFWDKNFTGTLTPDEMDRVRDRRAVIKPVPPVPIRCIVIYVGSKDEPSLVPLDRTAEEARTVSREAGFSAYRLTLPRAWITDRRIETRGGITTATAMITQNKRAPADTHHNGRTTKRTRPADTGKQ